MVKNLPAQVVLDGLGQGVLIFDSANRLVMENAAARSILGTDLKLIRSEGWPAAATLFNAGSAEFEDLDAIRARALTSERAVRFRAFLTGEHVPCWASAIHGENGEVYTVLTIELADWSALSELLGKYLDEVREAAEATRGHAELINQTLRRAKPNESIDSIGRRLTGFTRIIHTHMHRLIRLSEKMERFEAIRTNRVRAEIRDRLRKVQLADFIEDFLEGLDDDALADPEADLHDLRRRIHATIPDDLTVEASPAHLSLILRDILRNAIMYSLTGTPVQVMAFANPKDHSVQIDVTDEGYGIRASESERVFAPFARARQPQIMGEFGYGISLYLCKYEIEAMGGRIWYTSEEGAGTTFSLKLPAWRDAASSSSHMA